MWKATAPPVDDATSDLPVTFKIAEHEEILLLSNKNVIFRLDMLPLIKELRTSDDVACELAPK
jgi:hypothetical protein